jgi:hypothetical protein
MSRDRAIRFTVNYVIDTPGMGWTPGEWRTRSRGQIPADGKPTVENLKKHCLHYEASTQEGGCNSHLGATKILRAWIFDHEAGQTVVEYTRDA